MTAPTRSRDRAFARYEPTKEEPWDLGRVAHLHRRAGFGATWDELERDLAEGPQAAIDRLLAGREAPDEERSLAAALRDSATELRPLQAWWLWRILFGGDPLREKLTLFWHDHFATSVRKVRSLPAMATQNERLRELALGTMTDLTEAMVSDPAMLIWLDGARSRPEHPNENFAREFFELFTLGVGHYGEEDVREAARAFTGWRPRSRTRDFEFVYDPTLHDPGRKTILGESADYDAASLVQRTVTRRESARFVCRKLHDFLIDETTAPSAEDLEELVEVYLASQTSIRAVVEVILRSARFHSAAVRRARVRCPVEWCVALLRALEVPRNTLRLLSVAESCDRQGMSLFEPPSVAGWAFGLGWLGSAAILERTNFAARILWGSEEYGIPGFDAVAWCERHGIETARAPQALGRLLLQDLAAPVLETCASGGDHDGESLRKIAHALLSSPWAQLA